MASKPAPVSSNFTDPNQWIRLLLMIVYLFVNYLVRFLTMLIAVVQFLFTMLANEPNQQLLVFSKQLARFSYQIMLFVFYATEERPFPFSSWPAE